MNSRDCFEELNRDDLGLIMVGSTQLQTNAESESEKTTIDNLLDYLTPFPVSTSSPYIYH